MNLISSTPAKRELASSDVLDWQHFSTWESALWELVNDFIDERVINHLQNDPPKWIVGDDLGWLDSCIFEVRSETIDSKLLTSERIQKRFKTIRAAHGTRTDKVETFYRYGLKPLDAECVRVRARSIFLSGSFPEIAPQMLDQAMCNVDDIGRAGRLYFEANERVLIEDCCHYMLYGSEYLCAIAAHIDGPRDYRSVLKRIGQPTVFMCDVPLVAMHPDLIADFAGSALEYIIRSRLHGDAYAPDPYEGGCCSIQETLPPEQIVGHYHPQHLRDRIKR